MHDKRRVPLSLFKKCIPKYRKFENMKAHQIRACFSALGITQAESPDKIIPLDTGLGFYPYSFWDMLSNAINSYFLYSLYAEMPKNSEIARERGRLKNLLEKIEEIYSSNREITWDAIIGVDVRRPNTINSDYSAFNNFVKSSELLLEKLRREAEGFSTSITAERDNTIRKDAYFRYLNCLDVAFSCHVTKVSRSGKPSFRDVAYSLLPFDDVNAIRSDFGSKEARLKTYEKEKEWRDSLQGKRKWKIGVEA